MTKHTRGPWGRNIKPASKYNTIYAGDAPNHVHICHLNTRGLSAEEIEANCDLITAAPLMYDLLAEINEVFYTTNSTAKLRGVMSKTKLLLRHARGEV